MTMTLLKPEEVDLSRGSSLAPISMHQWRQFFGRTFECRALICPESDGGFSAFALHLPGVVSQGNTVEESLANIKDAFRESIRAYLDLGMAIPWGDADVERADGAIELWVIVDV